LPYPLKGIKNLSPKKRVRDDFSALAEYQS
jgi:hypothetical protein